MEQWHGTTILGVKKGGKTVIAGDGQVSMGNTVMKPNAKKVRRIGENGDVIGGFAGATADAFTLFERLERKLEQYNGQLMRAAVGPDRLLGDFSGEADGRKQNRSGHDLHPRRRAPFDRLRAPRARRPSTMLGATLRFSKGRGAPRVGDRKRGDRTHCVTTESAKRSRSSRERPRDLPRRRPTNRVRDA